MTCIKVGWMYTVSRVSPESSSVKNVICWRFEIFSFFMIEIRHIPSCFPAITLQIQREAQPDVCRFIAQCCTRGTATLQQCSLVSPAQTLLTEPRNGWSEPTIPAHISKQTICVYTATRYTSNSQLTANHKWITGLFLQHWRNEKYC